MSIKPGIYKHFKGGYYVVYGSATYPTPENTFRPMVLYKGCSKKLATDWGPVVRPEDEFTAEVELDGVKQARFKYIQPSAYENVPSECITFAQSTEPYVDLNGLHSAMVSNDEL